MFYIFLTDAPGDYEEVSSTLTFPPCGTKECVDVPIVNDCDMEKDEYFTVVLDTVFYTERVYVNRAPMKINITDSDCMNNNICTYYVTCLSWFQISLCECKKIFTLSMRLKLRLWYVLLLSHNNAKEGLHLIYASVLFQTQQVCQISTVYVILKCITIKVQMEIIFQSPFI